MAGLLTLKELEKEAAAGKIDTVVACFPDMQGPAASPIGS
jgi:hypothetical protein